jgi:alkyl sulfatase BDS1-like metallo-beta-lactamase superfamily hydrolase
VAQVVHHVVFADSNNQAAKNLEADALEQLGYQAESGPWRNFYLTGAQELRNGVAKLPTPNTASPDTVRAMSVDMFFDYLGVRLNSEKAGNARAKLNFDLGQDGKYFVELENGVLNHTADMKANNADATVSLSRNVLNDIILQKTKLDDGISSGAVKVSGDQAKLRQVVSYLDTFEFWFNIVTP